MAFGIVLVAMLSAAFPALAQPQPQPQPQPLTVAPSIAKDLARLIRASGHDCPEVRTIYRIGADERGSIMRIVCGVVGGPAIEEPSFRMHATPAGAAKITRWGE